MRDDQNMFFVGVIFMLASVFLYNIKSDISLYFSGITIGCYICSFFLANNQKVKGSKI